MKKLLAVCCLALAVLPLRAQYSASESFSWDKIIVPGLLIGAGTVASFSPWYQRSIDTPLQAWALDVSGGKAFPLDNFLQFAPALGYAAAIPFACSEHTWQEKSLVLGTSFSVMMALVYGTKWLTAVERPNSARHSFPSGHTAMAFFGAEIVRQEYGPWWGLAAYSAAAVTGFLRVYNNWHWSSDVIAGAGVGILSGLIGYWLLPWEREVLGLDSGKAQVSAAPSYLPAPYNIPVVSLSVKF